MRIDYSMPEILHGMIKRAHELDEKPIRFTLNRREFENLKNDAWEFLKKTKSPDAAAISRDDRFCGIPIFIDDVQRGFLSTSARTDYASDTANT